MLIRVKATNYKSFEQETTLTMVSSSKIRKPEGHEIKVGRLPLLRHAVIYGGNASGKTNLIDVFSFVKRCVMSGLSTEASEMFCKNKSENIDKPSSFEIQFSMGKECYAYGFSAMLHEAQVREEWLYLLIPKGGATLIFSRQSDGAIQLGEQIMKHLNTDEHARWSTYMGDYRGQTKTTLLGFMNDKKSYAKDSQLVIFKRVFEWIKASIRIVRPNTDTHEMPIFASADSMKEVSELLSKFDTGVSQMTTHSMSIEELQKMVPSHIYSLLVSDLSTALDDEPSEVMGKRMMFRSRQSIVICDVKRGEEPSISTIKLTHGASPYPFHYREESDGTRRLLELLGILLNSAEDVVYVVDELERSLHPKLVAKFLALFNELKRGKRVQLIFTTHESTIMDQKLFRRDEIWFVDKDLHNNSKLYSLDTFKDRFDKVLAKAYLEGRYGALPVFGDFGSKGEETPA